MCPLSLTLNVRTFLATSGGVPSVGSYGMASCSPAQITFISMLSLPAVEGDSCNANVPAGLGSLPCRFSMLESKQFALNIAIFLVR